MLHKIIHSDQNGYIKDRYIGFNLRQIQDIIDYCEQYQIEGAIIFVDFSKAFDSLEWDFMNQVLKHFGFKESFITWVNLMYTDIFCSVINNGWISERFKCTRGIRQGCPLSALLFVLSVEIMAIRLRTEHNIKGIQVKLDKRNHNLKISQLADDTTLFLGTKNEITLALNVIEIFGTFSGLKLNRNKTEGLWVGKLKHCKEKVGGVQFSEKPVKALGIYFGHDTKECEKLNWEAKIAKIESLISTWRKRNLTMIGKILIIKSLVLPVFTFLASCTVTPVIYVKQIEKILFDFIWEGKKDKVKRNTIIGNLKDGGLNMPDIVSYFDSLKLSWIPRINTENEANWKILPWFHLQKFGKNLLIFKMNFNDIKNIPGIEKIPVFYYEIIKSWLKIGGGKKKNPENYREIRKQILWGNRFIKHNNKCLIFQNFIQSNILYVNDILDENGEISQDLILNKLKYKTNWISEVSILKKSIPKEWLQKCKTDESKNTKVNIKTYNMMFTIDKREIDVKLFNNKFFYRRLISLKFEKPLGIIKWLRQFEEVNDSDISKSLVFTFMFLEENKLKIFRWKLLNYILPNKCLLYQWKISTDNLCKHCNTKEDYQHFFIDCSLLKDFWQKVGRILTKLHFNKTITLRNLVLGYKIHDEKFYSFNYFLTIIAYSIYKCYYVSEQNTIKIDKYEIFKAECKKTFFLLRKTDKMRLLLLLFDSL